jgi:hypothetical protein
VVPFERFLFAQCVTTGVIAVIAYLVRWANARRSVKDRFVGWWVFALLVGGHAAAGTVNYIQTERHSFFVMSMWGGLFGLISGNVLGRVIWRVYGKQIQGDPDAREGG